MSHALPVLPLSNEKAPSLIGDVAGKPTVILLVEDNPADAHCIRELLLESGAGYGLAHVDRLETALHVLARQHYAAVLLDLALPDSQGLDTLRQVHDLCVDAPVIVVSGLGDEAFAMQALQAGAQDYLVKSHLDGHWLVRSIQYAIERMHTEQALRTAEARYRLLVENVTDVVCTLDMDLRIVDISPSIKRMLGYSPEELLATPPAQLLTPMSLAQFTQLALRLDRDTIFTSPTYALEARHKDGQCVWVEVKLSYLRNKAGQPSGVLIVGRDISARKQAEAERAQALERAILHAENLRQKEALEARVNERTAELQAAYQQLELELAERKRILEALQESERYARCIIESSLDMIISADNDFRIVEFNPAAQETFGYTPQEVQGQPISLLYADPGQGMALQHDVYTKGKVVLEVSARRKNGNTFPKLVSSSVMRNAQGDILGTVGVSRDISEQKRLEETLRSLSIVDELTGLHNRRGFLMLAEQRWLLARRTAQRFSLIFLDIDDLKKINDTYGHLEGDAALCRMADVLRHSFRRSDILAHLSGDEFIVLTLGTDHTAVEALVSRLLSNLDDANQHGDGRYAIACSAGTATFDPATPAPLMVLMGQADKAMYEQKRRKATTSASAGS